MKIHPVLSPESRATLKPDALSQPGTRIHVQPGGYERPGRREFETVAAPDVRLSPLRRPAIAPQDIEELYRRAKGALAAGNLREAYLAAREMLRSTEFLTADEGERGVRLSAREAGRRIMQQAYRRAIDIRDDELLKRVEIETTAYLGRLGKQARGGQSLEARLVTVCDDAPLMFLEPIANNAVRHALYLLEDCRFEEVLFVTDVVMAHNPNFAENNVSLQRCRAACGQALGLDSIAQRALKSKALSDPKFEYIRQSFIDDPLPLLKPEKQTESSQEAVAFRTPLQGSNAQHIFEHDGVAYRRLTPGMRSGAMTAMLVSPVEDGDKPQQRILMMFVHRQSSEVVAKQLVTTASLSQATWTLKPMDDQWLVVRHECYGNDGMVRSLYATGKGSVLFYDLDNSWLNITLGGSTSAYRLSTTGDVRSRVGKPFDPKQLCALLRDPKWSQHPEMFGLVAEALNVQFAPDDLNLEHTDPVTRLSLHALAKGLMHSDSDLKSERLGKALQGKLDEYPLTTEEQAAVLNPKTPEDSDETVWPHLSRLKPSVQAEIRARALEVLARPTEYYLMAAAYQAYRLAHPPCSDTVFGFEPVPGEYASAVAPLLLDDRFGQQVWGLSVVRVSCEVTRKEVMPALIRLASRPVEDAQGNVTGEGSIPTLGLIHDEAVGELSFLHRYTPKETRALASADPELLDLVAELYVRVDNSQARGACRYFLQQLPAAMTAPRYSAWLEQAAQDPFTHAQLARRAIEALGDGTAVSEAMLSHLDRIAKDGPEAIAQPALELVQRVRTAREAKPDRGR